MKMPSFFLESLRPNRGEVGWAAVSLSSAACICVLEVCLYAASTSGFVLVVVMSFSVWSGASKNRGEAKKQVLPPHAVRKGQQAEFQGAVAGTCWWLGGGFLAVGRFVLFEKKENQRCEYGEGGSSLMTRLRRSPALPTRQQQAWGQGALLGVRPAKLTKIRICVLRSGGAPTATRWAHAAHERPGTFDECRVLKGSSGREEVTKTTKKDLGSDRECLLSWGWCCSRGWGGHWG